MLSVSEVLTSLSDLSDLDATLGTALDRTLEIMRQDIGGVLLLEDDGKMLSYRVHRGLSPTYAAGMRLSLGEGIAGKVAQTGKPMISEDISSDPKAARPALIQADGLRAFASVPLRSKGRILGVLNIASHDARKFTSEDIRLLEGIARQIATAVENARLHHEMQRKDEIHQELLRQMFSIQEEERRRIARELHDETSQVLASLNASLEAAAGMLPPGTENAMTILRKAHSLSTDILENIHRLIYQLRPTLLDDLGLGAAARWLVEGLQAACIKGSFSVVGRERRLPTRLETTLFRVIQEAVANIIRHAHAKNAEVVLHFKKAAIAVHIADDGVGFDVEEAIRARDMPRGLGLLNMQERIELVNGVWTVRSHPGGGTKIDIEIPLRQGEGQWTG